MRNLEHHVDFCVVGGGMAGLVAALAAARRGVRVALMQDRPVLGGNASSEIRMWIGGAQGPENSKLDTREGGICEELFLENFYTNPSLRYSLWDATLYSAAVSEENLLLLLNTTCQSAEMKDGRIASVTGWQLNSETYHTVYARHFADCSGDSILAPLTGASYMYGREAKSEYGESIPPDVADKRTMGMSCLFQIRETDRKTEFTPPAWAYKFPTDDCIPFRDHGTNSNFWWIELGGEQDSLHDTDECRHELLKIVYGVWDHMKNYGDHGVDNWELEWIGFLPGKRETRRYVGAYVVNENDVRAEGKFPDTVAYGGWSMDDHFPAGFYYKEGHPTIYHPAPSPWGIPFRALYSKDIPNLLFAGRNISVTHAALSSCRVMATCALLGQAVGTAAAVMKEEGSDPATLTVAKLQEYLMEDDCYLPGFSRKVPDLTLSAETNAPVLRNGMDRGEENCWIGQAGDSVTYRFAKPEKVSEIRLVFDSNFKRNYHNMPCAYPLKEERFKLPATLITEYTIIFTYADGSKKEMPVKRNHLRFVRHKVDETVAAVTFRPEKTNGSPDYRLFDFEVK